MRCPKCNRLMTQTRFMLIENCLSCDTYFDVMDNKEVDPESYSDDEYKRLESSAFGGHKDVWIDVDGHQQRILGDPNMSEETKDALGNMIRAITKAIQNGDFKKKGEL